MTSRSAPSAWLFAVALLAYSATTCASALVALVWWSFVPSVPFYDSCGNQFLLILPLAIASLVASIPATWVAHRLGVSRVVTWAAPVPGLWSLLSWPGFYLNPSVSVPRRVALTTAFAIAGVAAVVYLIHWRRRWQSS
jgi:hypothetical protein